MVQITASISKELDQLNNKYRELQPHLDEIDQVYLKIVPKFLTIEIQVKITFQLAISTANLEQAAYKLDAFSKKLEAVMKSLEKRSTT
jgi:biogenesis of lysosome-related organelles complex 1 subunit 2